MKQSNLSLLALLSVASACVAPNQVAPSNAKTTESTEASAMSTEQVDTAASPAELKAEWTASEGASAPVKASYERADAPAQVAEQAPSVQPVQGSLPAEDVPGTSSRVGLSGADLALWNDPEFQRQFTLSYIAATEVEPTVTLPEREDLQKVLDYISSDRTDKALDMLIDENGPDKSAVYDFTLANIYFQRDTLELAGESYKDAVQKYPKFRRAWKNLGLIHVRDSAFEDAATCFGKVIELGGGDAVTYGLLGFAYSNTGQFISAESAYRMAVLLDPVTLDWKMGLARSFFKQRRFADAASLCENLIADDPERSDLWLLQANAFIGLGEPLRAAENFEMAGRLGAATPASLNSLGDIYINEELYELAFESYGRALELAPDGDVKRAIRAAKVLTARGALEESNQLIARIEELRGEVLTDGEKKDLLKLRARLAVAQGAGGEEARILEEIVAIDPLDGEALMLLGQHAERSGETEKAVFYYERAQGLEAHEPDACVRHAQLLVRQGKYKEALPLLRRAQAMKPRQHVQDFLEQVEQRAPKSR